MVSSSSDWEPSFATTKVWMSLTSVDGCAVSMVSVPNAEGYAIHASEAASSTWCLIVIGLEVIGAVLAGALVSGFEGSGRDLCRVARF